MPLRWCLLPLVRKLRKERAQARGNEGAAELRVFSSKTVMERLLPRWGGWEGGVELGQGLGLPW